MTVKEMRALLGFTQKQFSDAYSVPMRTIQHWENGDRECPAYVLQLLERCVLEDVKKGGCK